MPEGLTIAAIFACSAAVTDGSDWRLDREGDDVVRMTDGKPVWPAPGTGG